MSEHNPFTTEEIQLRRMWAEHEIGRSDSDIDIKANAFRELRYEASLQAKDATIAALVEALLIVEWQEQQVGEDDYEAVCPVCLQSGGQGHADDCQLGIAIKEAIDAS